MKFKKGDNNLKKIIVNKSLKMGSGAELVSQTRTRAATEIGLKQRGFACVVV